jgi:CHRD domain
MKKLVTLLIAMSIALALHASSSVAAAPMSATTTLKAHLKGSNEVGAAGASNGTGLASITVNLTKVGNLFKSQLCYKLTVSGFKLPAIGAHIHAGKAGKNGPIVVAFPKPPGKYGKSSGCTTAIPTLLKAITAHPTSYYVNVHTTAYPGGAVRGQLGM